MVGMKHRFERKPRGNRPIDRMRDGAGVVSIAPENGNIVGLKSIGDRLYMLAQRGVVSCEMADRIDPDRTNPDIPRVVQRIDISYGVEEAFIQKTLGAAFQLLNHTYLPDNVDEDEGRSHALDAAVALASIMDMTAEMQANQDETRIKLQAGDHTLGHLTRTNNLKGKIDGCISNLRQVEIAIQKLTLMFHPKAVHNDPWNKAFRATVIALYDESSEEAKYIEEVLTFLRAVVAHRDAMIHPKPAHKIVVHDYVLRADGVIMAPSIEIFHPEFALQRQDAASFLREQAENMAGVFEATLACLCNINAKSFADMFDCRVVALPEGETQHGSRVIWQSTVKPEHAQKLPLSKDVG